MNPPSATASRQGSTSVTLLAWIMIIVGVICLPISVTSAAMILVKSYGTQTSDPLGFFTIVLGPLILLACGVGFVRRWRWAWFGTLGLLVLITTVHGWKLIQGPKEAQILMSESGVPTTITGSGPDHTSLPVIALGAALLLKLVSRGVRAEFHISPPQLFSVKPTLPPSSPPTRDEIARTWRVGHLGRDMMFYEELIEGTWQHLDIDGEMLTGRAHHVIYFASTERWQSYPEWVRHRRSEIIARIQSKFRAPDYEYHNETSRPLPASPARPDIVASKQRLALGVVIALMLGIAAGMGYLVVRGIQEGTTFLPSKRASLRRVIIHEKEPASYWAALGIYSVVGLGSAGLALWGIGSAIQMKGKPR